MLISGPSSSSGAASDAGALAGLRSQAAGDPRAAIKAAAKQFETMFMQQLLKTMRESTQSSGMLENSGTQMGSEMLDAQYATKMSGLPGGLGDVIARQLERQLGSVTPGGSGSSGASGANGVNGVNNVKGAGAPVAAALPAASAAGAPQGTSSAAPTQTRFLSMHDAAAKAAEADSGIPAAFMVAQAAHESGWGKREIRNADGSSSHNLFGIKAGSSWTGKTASVTTTEVIDGQPRKVVAKFRAYDSYAESFADYAQMMKNNPRYANVVASGTNAQGFAQGLQRAGYATDPAYAAKLTRMINTTLRLQQAATQSSQRVA